MDKVINSLAKKIAANLVSHDKIQPGKLELYEYSALIAIQSAINMVTTLFIGFVFGAFVENICFFIAYKVLREYSGGLHSSKFSICFLISAVSNIAILIAIKMFEFYPNYYLAIILEVVSFLIVISFAPIANKNKPITEKERRIYKLVVCVVSLILVGISIILCLNKSSYVFALSLAMLLNSVLIIVEMIRKRICFDKFDYV